MSGEGPLLAVTAAGGSAETGYHQKFNTALLTPAGIVTTCRPVE